jgi:predicted DNA-binding ribbon-helix-helix protein
VRALLILIGAAALTACATARMHDQEALNDVALGCGMTYGELIQDEEEKKLLIALKNNISASQRACVTQWAKRNRLTPVFVSMEMPEG